MFVRTNNLGFYSYIVLTSCFWAHFVSTGTFTALILTNKTYYSCLYTVVGEGREVRTLTKPSNTNSTLN